MKNYPRTAAQPRADPPARALGPRPPARELHAHALPAGGPGHSRMLGRAGSGARLAVRPLLPPRPVCLSRPSPASFPEGPFLRWPSPRGLGAPGVPSYLSRLSDRVSFWLPLSLLPFPSLQAFLPLFSFLSATFWSYPRGSPNPPPGPLLLLLFTVCPGVSLLCPLYLPLWTFLAQILHVSPPTPGRLQPRGEGRW